MKTTPFVLVLALAICAGVPSAGAADDVQKAIAVLHPTANSKVMGTITFTKSGDELRVVADITGLTPGNHGFHIHEFGDCSAPDASSAGLHFDPTKHHHGAPDVTDRHAGDLGNIEADASGKAHLDWSDKVMKLSGEESIIGRSVIVHEKRDDLKTQPTGDSGGRLACGVVGIAKP